MLILESLLFRSRFLFYEPREIISDFILPPKLLLSFERNQGALLQRESNETDQVRVTPSDPCYFFRSWKSLQLCTNVRKSRPVWRHFILLAQQGSETWMSVIALDRLLSTISSAASTEAPPRILPRSCFFKLLLISSNRHVTWPFKRTSRGNVSTLNCVPFFLLWCLYFWTFFYFFMFVVLIDLFHKRFYSTSSKNRSGCYIYSTVRKSSAPYLI